MFSEQKNERNSDRKIDRKNLYYFSMFFLLYELTIYLSNDMIMPGMLQVVNDFNASKESIALSLSLYILGGSMLQIFLGPIADRVGKRKVMLAGNAMFLVATLCIPFASSIEQFLAARFFQGMGSCFIFIGYAMVHELFDDAEAVKLTTILSNAGIFAPLIGPVIGSVIVSQLHWQYVFIVSLLLGVITFAGLFRFMPVGKPSSHQFNFKSIKQSYLKIFRNKQFMVGILIAGAAITPLTAWIGLSPVIVMDHMQRSYGTYIAYQCIIFSGFILSTIAVQKLANNLSLKKMIQQGAWISLAGMSGFGLAYQYSELFILGMFIFSFGFGLFNGGLIRLAMIATGESMSLTSSAMSLLYCIYISIGLEVYNLVGERFSYSLASYALVNVPLGVVVFLSLMRFVKTHEADQPALAAST